jgi:uncharacterized protein involved in type VI secretion and phage assembly
MSKEFLGKFRGIVTDIQDPLMMGRIKAKVPDVFGDNDSGWALPCLLFGGSQMGMFVLPDVGSCVWIEFEHGDPSFPVWVGSWFGSKADMPSQLMSPPYKKTMLVTKSGHSIMLDDSPGAGGITLQTAGGQKIALSSQGIEIDNGNGALIKLSGSQVSVNNGALEVT